MSFTPNTKDWYFDLRAAIQSVELLQVEIELEQLGLESYRELLAELKAIAVAARPVKTGHLGL